MILLFLVIILIISMLEFIVGNKLENENRRPNGQFTEENNTLGYSAIKNKSTIVTKTRDNIIIYQVKYTTDNYGRQINNHTNGTPIILFGCSYTFGDGLNNNETISYELSKNQNLDIYNYALSGYGAQHMLAQIETINFTKEINNTKIIGIYTYISNHIFRMKMNFKWANSYNGELVYHLDNNKLIRTKFRLKHPLKFFVYQLLNKFRIIKYSMQDKGITNDDIYKMYKIIEKSKIDFENKTNGKLIVLIHLLSGDKLADNKLIKMLTENNIMVYDLRYKDKNLNQYKIKGDGHPNYKLNKQFSKQIINIIKNNS